MFHNCQEAEQAFNDCWLNPEYTQIELDNVDVNALLPFYHTNKPVQFTGTMLWDMETKKAWNPGKYIPYVVKKDSARSWGKHTCPLMGGDIFVRSSLQKQWLNPDIYEEVYEEVYVNPHKKLITFLGTISLPEMSHTLSPKQPLFHVQHGVAGSETHPINTWCIVHLTQKNDPILIQHFKNLNQPNTLPGFITEYIEKDLQIAIQHT
ncbi:MAG: hypothetical protein A3J38_09715 [Gammaproteobacteria bacterium RIFCSPHIGHO2_12_FULL_45_9]|nr:MAG: hypothetical protein A3J38_09715 [Gammaproteobacteria bacterium RIFCSPHIGHO2_12_FULL_45_9]